MIPEIIKDPSDSSSPLPWDDLTTYQQQLALQVFRQLVSKMRNKFLIEINLPKIWCDISGEHKYPKITYPVLFDTEEDAWTWFHLSGDPALRPPGARSWALKRIPSALPVDVVEPRVRKPDLSKNPEPRKRKR
jgi:hypothetical protein